MINSGPLMMGTIGSENRMDGTVIAIYIKRCEYAKFHGVSENWDGVTDFETK